MRELDSPWKESLDRFLPAFLEFFFPDVHAAIDWSRKYESLDKELQQLVRESETGKRLADKLFKVWRKDGEEAWLLIHIEVQNQPDADFPERMFVYYYRIFDRYRRPIVSLAVLGDEKPIWKPEFFDNTILGCGCRFNFRSVKLLDYAADLGILEQQANVFAPIVLAHVTDLQTKDAGERLGRKVRIVKSLFERGLNAEDVRQLFRLIDWLIDLPKELERQFADEIHRYEEEKKMPYVTSIERLAIEKGREEGIEEGIEKGIEKGREEGREEGLLLGRRDDVLRILRHRFKKLPKQVEAKVKAVDSLARLDRLFDAAVTCADLKKFSEILSK